MRRKSERRREECGGVFPTQRHPDPGKSTFLSVLSKFEIEKVCTIVLLLVVVAQYSFTVGSIAHKHFTVSSTAQVVGHACVPGDWLRLTISCQVKTFGQPD